MLKLSKQGRQTGQVQTVFLSKSCLLIRRKTFRGQGQVYFSHGLFLMNLTFWRSWWIFREARQRWLLMKQHYRTTSNVKSCTRLLRRMKHMSNLALIANVTCGNWKTYCLSQEAKLGFSICCGEEEASSSSAGFFQTNSAYDFLHDQMPREDCESKIPLLY